ncbi:hypothetical protein Fmac_004425 [Flemingia macrophylla]|uniref:Uncharacterized protein n=1 Tax=Flemingia macrophylla TaxID=520843 RepID=A0ABD1N4W6_9FABA
MDKPPNQFSYACTCIASSFIFLHFLRQLPPPSPPPPLLTRERLVGKSSGTEAFDEVRSFLKEAWQAMGPSFLETMKANDEEGLEGSNQRRKRKRK